MVLRTPFASSIFHAIGPWPVTGVVALVRLPNDEMLGVERLSVKSVRTGVIEFEAPVSMTIGSSPTIVEVKIKGSQNGK
jgi:hypothetical protein